MWIKSQDKKKLVESTNIFITYDNGTYIIKSFIEKYNYFDLGEYSTEEKAIKVLDKIQDYINRNLLNIYNHKFGIFQMPQEDEV